jgi:hypothetical protein
MAQWADHPFGTRFPKQMLQGSEEIGKYQISKGYPKDMTKICKN